MNPPPNGPAHAYLAALTERLAADGCTVTSPPWRDHSVVAAARGDRKARWMGTKVELFVFASVVPEVDLTTLGEFTGWAMSYAKGLRSGFSGARNAAFVLPALVSDRVQPEAAQWAAEDARLLGTTLIGRPITVQAVPQARRVTMYRGGTVLGGMFTKHVMTKAALYFP
ncbi:hypothetical protein AB0G79_04390 [Streptomyces sp. NPDC020807]|uniref:hypothetical protein n=1 Tax=Streptomyces sp. NPDC020807 TaxID=3155119 RepID=UPI0033C33E09